MSYHVHRVQKCSVFSACLLPALDSGKGPQRPGFLQNTVFNGNKLIAFVVSLFGIAVVLWRPPLIKPFVPALIRSTERAQTSTSSLTCVDLSSHRQPTHPPTHPPKHTHTHKRKLHHAPKCLRYNQPSIVDQQTWQHLSGFLLLSRFSSWRNHNQQFRLRPRHTVSCHHSFLSLLRCWWT